jgi:hypothetical protein
MEHRRWSTDDLVEQSSRGSKISRSAIAAELWGEPVGTKVKELRVSLKAEEKVGCTDAALGGVDSKDSLLGANQIQGCFSGGSLGCEGPFGFERHGVGADGAADYRSS